MLNLVCMNLGQYTALADPAWTVGGGGGLKRGGADCRRSRPGRVREEGTPPAQQGGMGERWKLPQKPALFALENPPKLRKNCNENIITDPAFIFSMCRTTVHSFTLTDADCDVPNCEKWSKRDSDCLYILNLAFLDGPAMLSAIDETHARARN